jgi:quercetin dioxygenase-like cupin family protein
MKTVTVTHWPANAGQVTINKVRARLEQEGLTPYRFDMMPGDAYGDHAHPEAEIRWVVSGRMRIMVREGARLGAPGAGGCEHDEEIILEPGDRLDLAANVVHSADVFGDEAVVTLCASR